MLSDLRFALRGLRTTPMFTALAVVTLALGIGANAAIFTMVDNVFFRGLAFDQPDRIYRLYANAPERGANQFPWSEAKFKLFHERQSVFSSLGADTFGAFTLTGVGDPILINGQRVTSNLFPLLGVRPIAGRLFRDDEQDAGPNVVIVSNTFWKTRLSGDPAVVGRSLSLDGDSYEIVGVIPDQPVTMFGQAEIWSTRPFTFPGYTPELRERGLGFLRVWGRLANGVSVEQATAQVLDLTNQYRQAHPAKVDAPLVNVLESVATNTVGNLRPAFLVLLGAVALVLLIASSNVANLLLVRFASRKREVAVRLALGSARRRILRLFLFESLAVSAMAVALGVVAGQFLLKAFADLLTGVPVTGELTLNPAVIGATALVGVLVGVLTGLYPALQAARANVIDAIKEGGRTSTPSRAHHWFRMVMVGGQVALSCVLLVGALLLLSSFDKLRRVDLGFDVDGLMIAGVNLPEGRYGSAAQQQIAIDRLLESLRHRPGLTGVTAAAGVPMTGFAVQGPFTSTEPEIPFNERPIGFFRYIGADFLSTLGARVVDGRAFTEADFSNPALVVLINERLARAAFPDGRAVGRFLRVGSRGGGERVEVLGVVEDIQSVTLTDPPPPEVYRPFSQRVAAGGFFQLLVRSASGDPLATIPTVRAALTEFDPNLPLIQPQAMTEVVGGAIAQQRLMLALLSLFAALAVFLAVIGLYSVLAFVVGQRSGEISVRLALGAQRLQVTALVWRQGMTPVVVGIVIGLASAAGLGRVVESQLFGTSATDPLTYTVTALSLLTAAAAATLAPALRSARQEIGRVLR